MANRHALLIGVSRYDDELFNDPRLGPAVRSDIAAMRAALLQSDYTVTECGIGNAERGGATLSRINRAIEEACVSVPAGGVLLIYFSGHGVTIEGTDYLVPSDAYRPTGSGSDGQPTIRSLVPTVPAAGVLRDCRARLVGFFVDACRDGSSGAEPSAEPGGQQPFLAGGGQFVLVTGCAAGQVCQYDETGSAFTQSLAKVLDARNPARTLAGVVDSVADDMRRRSRQSQGAPQDPVIRNPDVLKLVGGTEICDGDELTDAWRKAVDSSPLLILCDNKDLVRETVAECARRCGEAALALWDRTGLTDPWTDQDYPVRVLQNTELLMRNAGYLPSTGQGIEADVSQPGEARVLHPGEAALLLAGPFLREVVLAVGIRDAAAIDPANLGRTYVPGPRSDLELTHEMYPHLVRRATGLRQRGDSRAASQIALWLVHRWLTDRAKLWREAGAEDVCKLGGALIAGRRSSASEREVPRLVQALLLAVGADPADERLLSKLTAAYVDDRWRFLAAVLWLAGIMAADPRRLPPVVADLVGTRMELPLTEVQYAAALQVEWSSVDDDVLDLHLVCEHPALHDAFDDIVRRAAVAMETVRTRLALPPYLALSLPAGFRSSGLRPATSQDDEPAYDVPLSRFQIAEEKVRELLMGSQLYGDPALAIRELYQNALDACRWRAIRQEYLERTNESPGRWEGLISLTQATDDEGRSYIDCEDNGVGMDISTLKHVFANAGERFVYGQEFRAEQAAWADLEPPLRMVSNSQFGVGVFSYFMLADEITVLTRHQQRDGVVEGQAYEVRIASSGSLFQIRPATGLPGGGTRIRLYLSGDAASISVLNALCDLLWVSEHRVEVSVPEGNEAWKSGHLRYPGAGPEPLKCGDDLWWVPGQGGLAADGIKVGVDFYGLIVNLRGEQRPHFTVDRKTVSTWDAQWVAAQVSAAIPELMEWPGFSLSWLWEMTSSDTARAQEIFEYAASADRYVVVSENFSDGTPVPFSVVGCLASDFDLLSGHNRQTGNERFMKWRGAIWRHFGYNPRGLSENSVTGRRLGNVLPVRIVGFPVPDPNDGAILQRWAMDDRIESISAEELLSTFVTHQLTLRQGLRRFRKYVITGLRISTVRRFLRRDDLITEDDVKFLAALSWWQEWKRPQVVAALTEAALSLDQAPGDVLRRARSLGVFGWSNSDPELVRLLDDAVLDAERMFQLRRRVAALARLDGIVSPALLVDVSERTGLTIAEVLAHCDEMAVMGVVVSAREAYPAELNAIERQALKRIGGSGESLSLADLLLIAYEAKVSVGVVFDSLTGLEERGLLVRPILGDLGDHVPTQPEVELITGRSPLEQWNRMLRPTGTVSLWLRIAELIGGHEIGNEPLEPVAHTLLPFAAPSVPFTYADLAVAALRLNKTIGGAAAALHEIYPKTPLPQIPPGCAELIVPRSRPEAFRFVAGYSESSWNFAPEAIVRTALASGRPLGSLLGSLDPFRKLGAPLPPFDDTIRERLNKVKLDEYDEEMMFDVVRAAVTALQLVKTAGSFGWTLAEAHGRFARLVPIGFTLLYPQVDFPDEIVYWYDLLALSAHLDGEPPATFGRIKWVDLEQAAEEIFDCPPEEITAKAVFLRDRLRIYAPLFELELPEETTGAVG